MSRSRARSKKVAQISGHQSQKENNMTDETYDPSDFTAAEVVKELEDASEEERRQIAAAETAGKGRKSVLEAAGLEEGVRLDASGRELFPWEAAPEAQAQNLEV